MNVCIVWPCLAVIVKCLNEISARIKLLSQISTKDGTNRFICSCDDPHRDSCSSHSIERTNERKLSRELSENIECLWSIGQLSLLPRFTGKWKMIQWCPPSVVLVTATGRVLAASFPYHAANAFDWRRRMLQRKQMQWPLLEAQRSVQPQAGSATHSRGKEWRDGVDLIHISSEPDRIDSRRCFVPGALTSTVASVRTNSRHGGTKNRSLEGVSVCVSVHRSQSSYVLSFIPLVRWFGRRRFWCWVECSLRVKMKRNRSGGDKTGKSDPRIWRDNLSKMIIIQRWNKDTVIIPLLSRY